MIPLFKKEKKKEAAKKSIGLEQFGISLERPTCTSLVFQRMTVYTLVFTTIVTAAISFKITKYYYVYYYHFFSAPLRVKAYSSSTSLDQHHQSAAKDLTGSPVRSTPSTIQVTYLPSTGQRSKRPKHFLELKSFKDNYNTLESTLWEAAVYKCVLCGACVHQETTNCNTSFIWALKFTHKLDIHLITVSHTR